MFYVGQRVECVDAYGTVASFVGGVEVVDDLERELEEGRIYTIRGCVRKGEAYFVRLVGVRRRYSNDMPFRASRFRPLVERKTDISIFTRMLTPNKQGVDA